jgi:hypothetical protein
MLIDVYRTFTDPMTSYFRLGKTFNRSIKLYNYYPLKNINNEIRFETLAPESILKMIRRKIIHNSKYIVVGSYAFNYYVKKINYEKVKINYYEIITENIKIEAPKIYNILQSKLNNKVKVKEYYSFSEFFDKRVEFIYDDIVILKVYNNNNRCVVYNYSEKKKTNFGTTQLLSLYLLSNYIYYLINRKNKDSSNYLNMMLILIECRDKYLNKHNKTILDTTPFQEFKFKCIGDPVDIIRNDRLQMANKKLSGKLFKYKYIYKPTDNPIPPPINYIFDNSSGNQVLNDKYYIIKN